MYKKTILSVLIIITISYFMISNYVIFNNKSPLAYIKKSNLNQRKSISNTKQKLQESKLKTTNNTIPAFYKFTNISYKPQPDGSQWCWAACLEQMIKGLNSTSNIGQEQCEIVHYYQKNYTGLTGTVLSLNKNETCCGNNEFNEKCKYISLKPKDMENIFLKAGFKCDSIENFEEKFRNYKFLRKTLIDNDSPIILKTDYGEGDHMEFISGFGIQEGCEYVLISNPFEDDGEKYYPIDKFLTDYKNKIEKAWISKIIQKTTSEHNLKQDSSLLNFYKDINEIINQEKLKNNKQWNSLNENPITYLKVYTTLKKPIELEKKDFDLVFERNTRIKKALELFKPNESYCNNTINPSVIRSNNYGDVVDVVKSFFNNNININISIDKSEYFEMYATKVEKRILHNIIQYKPIYFPQDYNLEKKWISKTEFENLLQTFNKVKFFK